MRALGGVVALCILAAGGFWVLAGDVVGGSASAKLDNSRVQPGGSRPLTVTGAEALDGRELYIQTCASCHGVAGEGTQLGPDLRDSGLAAWDFYMRTGRMPLAELDTPTWAQREAQLTPEQIDAILAHAATFTRGPEIPTVVLDSGDLRVGWELYMNNCSSCHGVAGGGGVPGPGIVAPGLLDSEPRIVAEAVIVGPGLMPRFSFDDAQLNSLALYVEYLRRDLPAPGGIVTSTMGPVAEGFIAGLLGLGAVVLISRWVARRPSGGTEPGHQ